MLKEPKRAPTRKSGRVFVSLPTEEGTVQLRKSTTHDRTLWPMHQALVSFIFIGKKQKMGAIRSSSRTSSVSVRKFSRYTNNAPSGAGPPDPFPPTVGEHLTVRKKK